MKTGRLEAFSDGVLAIIITIMVLELSVPEVSSFDALKPLIPKFISYLLSFIYVGIYWNNHHHLFQATEKVNGAILWANLSLLFMLSLIPFTTAWMGENHFAQNPVALYGLNLLLCAVAYAFLMKAILKNEGKDSKIGTAVVNTKKENLSIILYLAGIIISFFTPIISVGILFIVAIIWIVPDTRIEKNLKP
ncbi:MAG: TMEM175 family protein [Ferruginibacter sp.]